MSFQEKEQLLKTRDAICGNIDELFDDIYPGRVEISKIYSGAISHAVAQTSGDKILFIDRKSCANIEGEQIMHYRVALGALEEECRRRNALVHTCILVLESDSIPHLELERVLHPHRKIFKGYDFVKPLVSYPELARWSGLVAASVLLDEDASELARIASYESNLHTFKERIRIGGIREKIRTIREGN